MAIYQAVLNDNNVCVGVKQTKGTIDDGKHVVIEDLDSDYIWRKYENEKWSEEKYMPEQKLTGPQITLEEMQMQTPLNTEYLVIMSELTNL